MSSFCYGGANRDFNESLYHEFHLKEIQIIVGNNVFEKKDIPNTEKSKHENTTHSLNGARSLVTERLFSFHTSSGVQIHITDALWVETSHQCGTTNAGHGTTNTDAGVGIGMKG